MTSPTSLELLREKYPGRVALTAAEVASVLSEKSSRGVVQVIRDHMKTGRIPGAVVVGKRLRMPITVLADVLDGRKPASKPMPVSPVSASHAPSSTGRQRSRIGPRAMGLVHVCRYWEELMGAWGEVELQGDIAQVREAVEHALGQIAAEQQAPSIRKAMPEPKAPAEVCPKCGKPMVGLHRCRL